ncbi:hypothetical protein F4778DRAFT_786686 [Xylariomycetidae sp. FL2044]|nr:hypothetical protein F4778DRAFT_786686 [Xylariomycetidae sp. FL2044]
MGVDIGFDMVPRLSRDGEDRLQWEQFITQVKSFYQGDEQVEIDSKLIMFKAGEWPSLPIEGHKFLRFSSKITRDNTVKTGVTDYIQQVKCMAKITFGDRIRPWSEAADELGFYSWKDVWPAIKSYQLDNTPEPEFLQINGSVGSYPSMPEISCSEFCRVMAIPGRGKGLVARYNLPKGTRVLCEKPLFTVRNAPDEQLHATVARELKSLSKDEQREFLSLSNNFPSRYVFAGIVRTNALTCGSGASVGGVYPNICLINHSCVPNAHNNWNDETGQETIHTIKNILAGEEVMISYEISKPSEARWRKLKDSFGFQCSCQLCTLPDEERRLSDGRRLEIKKLDEAIGDLYTMRINPSSSLKACHELSRLLEEEYQDGATIFLARLYYDAFQVSVAHGDQARAAVFAERAYKARVECEGEDSPTTRKAKCFMQDPSRHSTFNAYSKKWRSTKTAIPKNLDAADFDKWLWRLPS